MHYTVGHVSVVSRQRRRPRAASNATVRCEALEERTLLSTFGGPGAIGVKGSRAAEMSSFGAGRQDGMFGRGSFGLGGGMMNPSFLLTAPLLDGASTSPAPPSPTAMSSASVQTAFQTLQNDLKNDIPSGAQPTHASVGALQDDLDAIRNGTLSGTAAQTKIQSDQAAILSSMGLTSAQITQLQTDQQTLQTAIQTASSSSTTTSGSTSTTTSGSTSTTTSSTSPSPNSSAVQTAMNTLQTDLQNDSSTGAEPTHAAIGAVQDDLEAIRKGTLAGSAATTQVQTDAAAVLASMGMTAAQVTQIQADQQAVEAAMQANNSTSAPTTATSSATDSTLQSVSAYLVGIPGVSAFGMRGMDGGGFGGGFGRGPRDGF